MQQNEATAKTTTKSIKMNKGYERIFFMIPMRNNLYRIFLVWNILIRLVTTYQKEIDVSISMDN